MPAFDQLNSPEFVRRATAGEADAFRELFDTLAEPLAGFVERQGVPGPDAEEVAADALVKVNRALRTYRSDRGAKLTTWIFEIARRCAIDHHRAQVKRDVEAAEIRRECERGPGMAPEVGLVAKRSQDSDDLAAALHALSESDRDILRMRQVMEYAEIAAVEQATEQTIRVRHKRALDRLKQIVELGRAHGQQQA